jgi:hypothetical protein
MKKSETPEEKRKVRQDYIGACLRPGALDKSSG